MKMNSRIRQILPFLLLFCSSLLLQHGYAQSGQENASRYWVGTGAGIGFLTHSNHTSLSGAIYASYQSGSHLFGLRSAATGKFFNDSFYDFGVIYGRGVHRNDFLLSLGTGASLAAGKRTGGLFDDSESVGPIFGFPFELQLFIRPFRYAGMGVYGFANLNRKQTFCGAIFSVQIGKMGG
jgi:hypothetical protein